MKKTNLLQKLAPFGVIATTASLMLAATSANAALFDIETDLECNALSFECDGTFDDFVSSPTIIGDKEFTFINTDLVPSIDDRLIIVREGPSFVFNYEFDPVFDFARDPDGMFFFDYNVTVTGSEELITFVDLDTNVETFPPPAGFAEEEFTANYDPLVGPIVTLVNVNGDFLPPGSSAPITNTTSVNVNNVFNLDPSGQNLPGEISAWENSFVQESTNIPEPAFILGLLTIGALGLGLKRKN